MDTKTIIGSVLGGLALFAMGYLMYMVLLADVVTHRGGDADLLYIILGELVFGYLITWTAGVTGAKNPAAGAKAGAIMGVIVGLGVSFIELGEGARAEMTAYVVDVLVWGIRWGVAGAVVGWWLGRE